MENLRNINVAFGIVLVFLAGQSHSGDPEIQVINLSDIYERFERYQCYKLFFMTNEIRDNARKGILPDDFLFSCYTKCMLFAFGASDDLGEIYEDTLRPFFPQSEKDMIDKIVKICLPQPPKTYEEEYTCEAIFSFVKCCSNVNPKSLQYLPL